MAWHDEPVNKRATWLAGFVGIAVVLLGACSDDGGSADSVAPTSVSTGGTVDTSAACATGNWVSTSMDAPSQAGIGEITPTGGGDGMVIEMKPDGTFQIDFGPMKPATATFTTGAKQGILETTFSGVGEGTWTPEGPATFSDFGTVKATATLTLGETVPPIFDETLELLNANRMLGDEQVGVFAITDCTPDTLVLTTPFPGGEVVITAA
ncbi:MAG: hypothetical protein RL238_744, partial [Actinomycetota bacterium]